MLTHKHKYYKGRTLSSETECFSCFISMNCLKGLFVFFFCDDVFALRKMLFLNLR